MATPRELLAPYLEGTARENGDVDAHCPLHNDRRRSAVINFDEGVWYCNTEGVGGSIADLVSRRDEWVEPPGGSAASNGGTRRRDATDDLPTESMIAGWKAALMSDPVALDDLKAARGIWTKTADYYELGWDRSAQAYTIPVRDASGKLLNVRRYQLRPPAGRRKIWGVSGHNAPTLFPWSVVKKDPEEIIVCEGEFDAIICNQYNFRTVTRTGSARVWKASWNETFRDRLVYICHDCDTAGQDANRKVARALTRVAREVRIIRLPYPITEKGGKDLTDWWLEHDADKDAFRRLLEDALIFDELTMSEAPEEIDPSPASVLDAFDSRRAGRPLALTVTVKGKHEPGYSVPRKVEFRCTRDMGAKCEVCPMKGAEGAMDRTVASADPATLEMIGATKAQVSDVLRRIQGIPKCPKLNIKVAEHQAVEVLFARPSVEHSNGSGTEDYKNIKLTSVGRHDTSPNQTVRIVGALHPDPRKQHNEFLTWDVARLETSLDRFELDAETVEAMSVFQPSPGQKPLAKIRDIADDWTTHVTHIYGRPELHAAIDLVFHSVIGFDFDGKEFQRGWLELLVVGDTRTGKSEVATRMTRWYSAGEVVSCEAASFAGIFGGLQQFGSNKEWATTWGAIPINDRRLVVLDEISGLTPEDIGALSSVRSSGIADITKIVQERTKARTRLIWLGNPRGGRMSDYTYGVQAIRPLIGNPEDIARFDLAMSVASGDVPSSDINRLRRDVPPRYSQEAAMSLLRWVWSRQPDQVEWEEGAELAVLSAAEKLGSQYVEDPPLIQVASVREKVARLAVAIAARLFSTDARHENVVVKRAHVRAAFAFIDRLYNMEGFGYAARSREILGDLRAAEENVEPARSVLRRNPGLDKFLRSQGKIRRQDLEEILDIDREEANAIISELYDLRMIYKQKGDILLTPPLHTLLKEKRRAAR